MAALPTPTTARECGFDSLVVAFTTSMVGFGCAVVCEAASDTRGRRGRHDILIAAAAAVAAAMFLLRPH